ncbi:hypothetical protein C6N75_08365 [Streptomyces solincola]|uniref:ABC transporter permease n=1 Tax=Streptomyces solincola TaxID=2100817 RepID=A0A2S9PZ64_9ACTN|nr:hypothetical protein [Streptomyces solincola]PRH79643.1 hypothetical protein C6N75_08365 [Streptomyces solincola]
MSSTSPGIGGRRIGVLTAELARLKRPSPIITAACVITATAALGSLLALLLPGQAGGDAASTDAGAARIPMDLAMLAQPDGAVAALRMLAPQIGIVAYCQFTLSTGRDLTHGTTRYLRIQGPSGYRIHVGRLLVLGALTTATIGAALLVSAIATAVAMAARGTELHHWATAAALTGALQQWAGAALAACCLGALGSFVALATRSGGAAIGIGLVALLVFDPLLSIWEPLRGRTPGALLNNVAWCAPDSGLAALAVVTATLLAGWAGTALYGWQSSRI